MPSSPASDATCEAAEAGRAPSRASTSSSDSKEGSPAGGQASVPQLRLRATGPAKGAAAAFRDRRAVAAALCKARQDILLSTFVTRPAMWSPVFNFLQASTRPRPPPACPPACQLAHPLALLSWPLRGGPTQHSGLSVQALA